MPRTGRQKMLVLFACLAGIFLTSCRQLTLEPATSVASPLTERYVQPNEQYSLILPQTWSGRYQVHIDGPDTYFSYVPKSGTPEVVFSIHQTTAQQWLDLSQDSTQLVSELGSRKNTIYYAQISPTNPYPSATDGQRYQQFSLDVPRILETFDLSPEISSRLELDESR